MTTIQHTTGPSLLGRLRKATAPEAIDRVLPARHHTASTVLSALAMAAVVFATPNLADEFGLTIAVNGVVAYFAARAAEHRITVRARPATLPRWSVVASTIVAAILDHHTLSFLPTWGILLLTLLWVSDPWLARFGSHAAEAVNWGLDWKIAPTLDTVEGDDHSMTRWDDPEEHAQYMQHLSHQLADLDDWEVLEGRRGTDAIATGPGGLVALFSVTLEDVQLTTVDTEEPDADLIAQNGSVALRELGNLLVPGSRASTQTLPRRAGDQRDPHEVDAIHYEDIAAANTLRSSFVDAEGTDAGLLLPPMPAQSGAYLAESVHMYADQWPTIVYIAHGVEMDRPWGRVEVRTPQRGWLGSAILCHPRHVAALLDSLPGAMESRAAVVAAQHAVDITLR